LQVSFASRLFRLGKLTFVSDDDEFRTPSGVPCGSISGLAARMQHWLVRDSYVLPPESAKIHNVETKYYLAWRLGMQRAIGMWVSPNPSTHLNLARFGERHAELLIRDIHNGTLSAEFPLPEPSSKKFSGRSSRTVRGGTVGHRRAAGRSAQRCLADAGTYRLLDGGSMEAYLRSFPEYFGTAVPRISG
jgi:hypothetical protein